jgi:hypothetical protein
MYTESMNNSNISLLPPIQSSLNTGPTPRNDQKNKKDNNRFVISKETIKEFNMNERDIPAEMREVLDVNF